MLNATDSAALAATKDAVLNAPHEPERRDASNEFLRLMATIASASYASVEAMAALENYGDEPLDKEVCDALISLLDKSTL